MSRRREHKKSRKKLAYGVIVIVFIFLCFLVYFSLHQSNQTSDGNATPPRVQAAIVDHLNFTGQSNPTFVKECTNILESGGLTWTYYKGENVTVNFYRNLPSCGTSLIILRVHSAIMKTEKGIISILGLFTSEPCTAETVNKYPDDVLHDRLVNATFSTGEEGYFGIVPEFIEESMKGKFEDTIIIMMGCEGLGYVNTLTGAQVTYTDMAQAFINKGAKVYIGWDGPVGINHTDQATVQLLKSLILHNRTIKRAVTETKEIVGEDPTYNSTLHYYPKTAEVGDYTIPNLKNNLIVNVACTSSLTAEAPIKTKYIA